MQESKTNKLQKTMEKVKGNREETKETKNLKENQDIVPKEVTKEDIEKISKKINENKNKKEKRKVIGKVLALTTLALMIIFRSKILSVSGTSMYPTLNDGQFIRIEKMVKDQKLHINDIVIFSNKKTMGKYIKRVIAVEGDTVQIKEDGKVYVNGKVRKENFDKITLVNYKKIIYGKDPLKIKKGEVFVMGDNRNNSCDSREIGPVKIKDIQSCLVKDLKIEKKEKSLLK